MTIKTVIDRFNSTFAVRLTVIIGSIWAFYVFFLYGLVPVFWPHTEVAILYWSNFLQLIFLPLISVGTNVLNQANVKRDTQDHEAIMAELKIVKEMNLKLQTLIQQK